VVERIQGVVTQRHANEGKSICPSSFSPDTAASWFQNSSPPVGGAVPVLRVEDAKGHAADGLVVDKVRARGEHVVYAGCHVAVQVAPDGGV
jgi:hypothetical protein